MKNKKAPKVKCTPGCPNKFDETCCRSRGESPDDLPAIQVQFVNRTTVPTRMLFGHPANIMDVSEATGQDLDNMARLSVSDDPVVEQYFREHSEEANRAYGPALEWFENSGLMDDVRRTLLMSDPDTMKTVDLIDKSTFFGTNAPRTIHGLVNVMSESSDGTVKMGTITIHDPVSIAQVKGNGVTSVSVGYRVEPVDGKRLCERSGCNNVAVRDKGVARWTRLCEYHNEKRTEAIKESQNRPDCVCGNKLPRVGQVCSRCANIAAAARITEGAPGCEIDVIKRDVRELVLLALKGEIGYIQGQKALKQILQNLESIRHDAVKSPFTDEEV